MKISIVEQGVNAEIDVRGTGVDCIGYKGKSELIFSTEDSDIVLIMDDDLLEKVMKVIGKQRGKN